MQDSPGTTEILAAASRFVREALVPALPPDLSYNARVLANALDLVVRQINEDPHAVSDCHARLVTLLEQDGPETVLDAELARRIEAGEVSLQDPALIEHLWRATLAKLAVDQPRYASYLAETDESNRLESIRNS